MTTTNIATSVKLPPEVAQRLDQLSQKTGRSKSFYLRQAVVEHIDQLEWEYDVLEEIAGVRAGSIPTFTLDEVNSELNLDD